MPKPGSKRSRLRLAKVQAQHQAEERKAFQKRCLQVGALAHEAGLFLLDDATLSQLFSLLARVVETPNPVAVLDALLSDAGGPTEAC